MKTNMGTSDRIIRTMLATAAITLYATGIITGTVGVVLLVLSGIFLLTSVVSICPLYSVLGMNTCPDSR